MEASLLKNKPNGGLYMKKIKFLFILFAAIFLGSCEIETNLDDDNSTSGSGSASVEDSTSSSASGSSYSSEQNIYIKLSGEYSTDNTKWLDIEAASSSSEAAALFDESARVYYTMYDGESTGVIRVDLSDVTAETAIYLYGSMTSGGVKVQTSTSYETGIYLNDVEITSSNFPCLECTKAGAVSLFLSGTNTFEDGRSYGTGYGEEYSTTSGTYTDEDGQSQSYTVVQKAEQNGSDAKGTLFAKGNLTICGDGSLSIEQSYKHCIASKSILTIENGSFDLTSNGKCGLYGDCGVEISGGDISFSGTGSISSSTCRKAHGIKTDTDTYSDSYVYISGGSIDIEAYNGKGINTSIVKISGGEVRASITGTTSYTSNSAGTLEAFGGFGGSSGPGSSSSSSTYTYYDADGVSVTESISFAPEGIEAESSIAISGGSTYVYALDDGLNASNTGASLKISGGFLYVEAKGDGLDSNGNITISGGTVVVSQNDSGNSPIDCGDSYSFSVSGSSAIVFAMGSSNMFSESIPSSTSIPMIYSTSISGSGSLGVDGIIGVSSPLSYGAAVLVSPSLTSGTSYKFLKSGTISGTECMSDTGVYCPASISGGSSVSATATTSSSSSSSRW